MYRNLKVFNPMNPSISSKGKTNLPFRLYESDSQSINLVSPESAMNRRKIINPIKQEVVNLKKSALNKCYSNEIHDNSENWIGTQSKKQQSSNEINFGDNTHSLHASAFLTNRQKSKIGWTGPIFPESTGLKWNRILLKLSGEALLGDSQFGIDNSIIAHIVKEMKKVYKFLSINERNIEVGIVIGGGNIYRGISIAEKGGNRIIGDHMGMLATVMNGLALSDALNSAGMKSRVLSAIEIPDICESFTQRAAQSYMAAGEILVFVGGTGNPLFTTDSAAALRAAEMKCDVILKATKVDGIYTSDPFISSKATRFKKISHSEVIERGLKIMDTAAFALAHENDIPVIVFSIHTPNALIDVLQGMGRSTIVTD